MQLLRKVIAFFWHKKVASSESESFNALSKTTTNFFGFDSKH